MPKVQVTLPDGSVQPIELGNIEFGDHAVLKSELASYYTKSKDDFEEQIQDRLTKQADSLKANPEFVQKVFRDHGIEVDTEGKPILGEAQNLNSLVETQLTARQQDWEKEKFTPLQEQYTEASTQLESATSTNQVLRNQVKQLEIERAARAAKVKDEKFKRLPSAPPETAPFFAQTQHLFDFDENNQLALLTEDGKGFVPNPNKEHGRPHAHPGTYFDQMKGDETLAADWFETTEVTGPDVRNNSDTHRETAPPAAPTGDAALMAKYRGMQFGQPA